MKKIALLTVLILMFVLLLTRIIKVSQVKKTGDFLISLMPIMFVAPCVGLMEKFDACKELILPILISATLSTFIVMGVTGFVSQAIIKKQDKKGEADNVK